jgi:mannose-6-phosphate isomerase-like protein (cupin superfamily)
MTTPRIQAAGVPRAEALNSTLASCRIVHLPRIDDLRGNLSFVEERRHIPFAIRRVYWLYDVPGGATRDGHAYYTLEEFIIAVSGSFDVAIDDGKEQQVVQLNRSYVGLYVPPMVWRRFENFSSNSVALILASQPFSEQDYLCEYQDFIHQGKRK